MTMETDPSRPDLGHLVPPRLPFLPGEASSASVRVEEVALADASGGAAPFRASRFFVEPHGWSRKDSHAAHECWFVAGGQGELHYHDQAVRVTAGDVCYFAPFRSHQVHNVGDAKLEIFSVWWAQDAAASTSAAVAIEQNR